MAGYLPTWVGILLAVGGAEIFARHGYGGGVGYEWLAGLNFKNIDFSKSNFENFGYLFVWGRWGGGGGEVTQFCSPLSLIVEIRLHLIFILQNNHL